jgi:hypothetical protein
MQKELQAPKLILSRKWTGIMPLSALALMFLLTKAVSRFQELRIVDSAASNLV